MKVIISESFPCSKVRHGSRNDDDDNDDDNDVDNKDDDEDNDDNDNSVYTYHDTSRS